MNKIKISDFKQEFRDNDACLEWLKTKLYPDGIECAVCQRKTAHTKVSKRPCYACTICGHQISPTAGTIFYKSATPLKTWFKVIRQMSEIRGRLSAKYVQREYGMTYKTAWRMVHKIKGFLNENKSGAVTSVNTDESNISKVNSRIILNAGGKDITKPLNIFPNANIVSNVESFSLENSNSNRNIRKHRQKLDRTARLIRLQLLLCQYPQGLHIAEITSKLLISERTIYRDLRTLESELNVPIWGEGTKRGINEGYFLPPISFTLEEAHNFFGAARMLQNFYSGYIPSAVSTYFKLNAVAPPFFKKYISNILEHIQKQPRNNTLLTNYDKFMLAWTTQHKIRILYVDNIDDRDAVEHIIEPYFVDPSMIDRVIHIIGYSNITKAVSSFRFDHIVGDIRVEPDIYQTPEKFNNNIIDYLEDAWGIRFDSETITAKLRFKPKVRDFALKLYIHPSQKINMQRDGSVIMTLKVRDTLNFRNWIVEWGDSVEVLEPQSLRSQIYNLGQSLIKTYAP